MHGEELIIGGNPALAQQYIEEHNVHIQARRLTHETAEQRRMDQVANLTGNLAAKEHKPYFVQS